jgi:hypothetical protein
MATQTANDLITQALKKAGVTGVGQNAAPADMLDAFDELNLMLDEWSADNLMVYTKNDVVFQSTGALSYTIGPGMQFNCPRPEQLQFAFARQNGGTPQPFDYPMHVIETFEEYNAINLKDLGAFPGYIFYDGGFPTGTVKTWPVVNNQFEIHLSANSPLTELTDPADSFVLPAKYKVAVLYSLTERLITNYTLPANPDVARIAAKARLTVKRSNTRTPVMSMPNDLVQTRRYNIFGDTFR